jgi:hypothetical protein
LFDENTTRSRDRKDSEGDNKMILRGAPSIDADRGGRQINTQYPRIVVSEDQWLTIFAINPQSRPAGYGLDHFCQLSMNDDSLYWDPDYPWDAYL